MKSLRKRLSAYTKPQEAMAIGVYPFYQAIQSGQDTEVLIDGKKILMFGSNSYLGLTNHPEMKQAAMDAVKKYGTGASGSRLMNGNLDLHEELEYQLADFVGKNSAAVYSTGFQTNLGSISCLLSRNDYLILDQKNHASIYEGSRLSYAKTLKYHHADMASLEKTLKTCPADAIKLIVTDGVFSMEGDIAQLDEITRLADKYDASVLVDDAHALGVIGERGSGTASYYNCSNNTDLIMGTFSKSLASLGGFIAGDFETINFIKHNARALLFSASIPPASAATVLKGLELIKREAWRRDRLWENTNYTIERLKTEGFYLGDTETPIIPIHIGEDIKTYNFYTWLFKKGVFVNPVVHPAVPKNQGILRFSLMATHTKEQIDYAINSIIECRNYMERAVAI